MIFPPRAGGDWCVYRGTAGGGSNRARGRVDTAAGCLGFRPQATGAQLGEALAGWIESAGCLWGLCPVAGSSAILPEEQRGMKGRHTDVAPAGDRRPSQEMSCLAAGMKPPLPFGSFSQPPSPIHSFTDHRHPHNHTQMSIHDLSIKMPF